MALVLDINVFEMEADHNNCSINDNSDNYPDAQKLREWACSRRGVNKSIQYYTFLELLYLRRYTSLFNCLPYFIDQGSDWHKEDRMYPKTVRILYDFIKTFDKESFNNMGYGSYDERSLDDCLEDLEGQFESGDLSMSDISANFTLDPRGFTKQLIWLIAELHGKDLSEGKDAAYIDGEIRELVGAWDSVIGLHLTPDRTPSEVRHKSFLFCSLATRTTVVGCEFRDCELGSVFPANIVGCDFHNCFGPAKEIPIGWFDQPAKLHNLITYSHGRVTPEQLVGLHARIV